eukprot:EG_transcript_27608
MLRAAHPTERVPGRGCRLDSDTARHFTYHIQVSLWQKKARQLHGRTETAVVKMMKKMQQLEGNISLLREEQFRHHQEVHRAFVEVTAKMHQLENEISMVREKQFGAQHEKAVTPSPASTQEQELQRMQKELLEERALVHRMAAELRVLHQELEGRCKLLEQVQCRDQHVMKKMQQLEGNISLLREEQFRHHQEVHRAFVEVTAKMHQLENEISMVREKQFGAQHEKAVTPS